MRRKAVRPLEKRLLASLQRTTSLFIIEADF